MRELIFRSLPAEHPRPTPGDWLAELRQILFEGTGPGEGRLESLLDRLERRR